MASVELPAYRPGQLHIGQSAFRPEGLYEAAAPIFLAMRH